MDYDQAMYKGAAMLERIGEKHLARARATLATDPNSLSDYERGILGWEYHQWVTDTEKARKAADVIRAQAVAAICPKGIVFRKTLLHDLNQHAIDIAVQYGITVKRREDGRGFAHNEARAIETPAVTCEQHYATFMHEVGHVVDPQADSRQYAYDIVKREDGGSSLIALRGEVGAWTWARTNALVWTLEMHERLFQCLGRYSHRATPGERPAVVACVQSSCLHITGKAWTFEELEAKCSELGNESNATIHRLHFPG